MIGWLVFYDVLELFGPDARLLYVGKTAGYHSRTQAFGKGGEEMDFLQQEGIQVIPMKNAADPDSTLVVYMGLSTPPSLALKLMQHGLPANTPAAAVERGTTPYRVFAELKDLADKVGQEELASPTLIIIGKVVAL